VSPALAQPVSAWAILGVVLGFDVYCLRDLARTEITFVFPHRFWFLLIVFATPFGGIAYLQLGRGR
jgi:hypothetical protein